MLLMYKKRPSRIIFFQQNELNSQRKIMGKASFVRGYLSLKTSPDRHLVGRNLNFSEDCFWGI